MFCLFRSRYSGEKFTDGESFDELADVTLKNGERFSFIPKIIHQTWKDNNLPKDFAKWSTECKKLHPDWEYRLWTDHDNREFIQNEYDNQSDCQSNSGNWIDEERLVYVEDNNNSFLAKIDIDTSKIPKVRIAELFYQQYNVKSPFKFEPNENTLTGYNIGVDMADNMVFILKGRTTYIPTGDGGYESVKTTQIETQILF